MNCVFLPSHLDSGNRGCEAITKGTNTILKDEYEIIALSQNLQLDNEIGFQGIELRSLHKVMDRYENNSKLMNFIVRVVRKLYRQRIFRAKYYRNRYQETFLNYKKGDVALSTGGDMFCYSDDLETINLVDYLYKDKIPTILWGCSIGKENLTQRKIEVLRKFSAVVTRESLTESVLKDELKLEHVYCFPDPAFVLKPEKCELPKFFNKGIVGVNLSNFVGENVDFSTMVGQNIINLFDDILNNTTLDIVLIPHVFWLRQDDRIVCNAFYERYKHTQRVHILNTEILNYCQIRYAISKCSFFIGARTHAMISAYSTCIPSLALGYSIKSIGIAKDIGLPQELVVDYRTLSAPDEFSKAFSYVLKNEGDIRDYLNSVMPNYIKNAYEMKKVIKNVVNK